ncbi:MAG: hypothetical protein Gaeavirus5_10 [Gaeavirus sp.]|uniref:Uncharacterized protein n=1 Tax=Gaeavirus sp. TaxID=2487767 RepID=A0A3G5A2F0_9VIRU|nr:MAG: hypothetical protein Gaeavirus5_10 [Gaeavirus sp.]
MSSPYSNSRRETPSSGPAGTGSQSSSSSSCRDRVAAQAALALSQVPTISTSATATAMRGTVRYSPLEMMEQTNVRSSPMRGNTPYTPGSSRGPSRTSNYSRSSTTPSGSNSRTNLTGAEIKAEIGIWAASNKSLEMMMADFHAIKDGRRYTNREIWERHCKRHIVINLIFNMRPDILHLISEEFKMNERLKREGMSTTPPNEFDLLHQTENSYVNKVIDQLNYLSGVIETGKFSALKYIVWPKGKIPNTPADVADVITMINLLISDFGYNIFSCDTVGEVVKESIFGALLKDDNPIPERWRHIIYDTLIRDNSFDRYSGKFCGDFNKFSGQEHTNVDLKTAKLITTEVTAVSSDAFLNKFLFVLYRFQEEALKPIFRMMINNNTSVIVTETCTVIVEQIKLIFSDVNSADSDMNRFFDSIDIPTYKMNIASMIINHGIEWIDEAVLTKNESERAKSLSQYRIAYFAVLGIMYKMGIMRNVIIRKIIDFTMAGPSVLNAIIIFMTHSGFMIYNGKEAKNNLRTKDPLIRTLFVQFLKRYTKADAMSERARCVSIFDLTFVEANLWIAANDSMEPTKSTFDDSVFSFVNAVDNSGPIVPDTVDDWDADVSSTVTDSSVPVTVLVGETESEDLLKSLRLYKRLRNDTVEEQSRLLDAIESIESNSDEDKRMRAEYKEQRKISSQRLAEYKDLLVHTEKRISTLLETQGTQYTIVDHEFFISNAISTVLPTVFEDVNPGSDSMIPTVVDSVVPVTVDDWNANTPTLEVNVVPVSEVNTVTVSLTASVTTTGSTTSISVDATISTSSVTNKSFKPYNKRTGRKNSDKTPAKVNPFSLSTINTTVLPDVKVVPDTVDDWGSSVSVSSSVSDVRASTSMHSVSVPVPTPTSTSASVCKPIDLPSKSVTFPEFIATGRISEQLLHKLYVLKHKEDAIMKELEELHKDPHQKHYEHLIESNLIELKNICPDSEELYQCLTDILDRQSVPDTRITQDVLSTFPSF